MSRLVRLFSAEELSSIPAFQTVNANIDDNITNGIKTNMVDQEPVHAKHATIQYRGLPMFHEDLPDEQRLMNYLFQGYERTVRPVRNASTAVVIRMGLTLTQIFDMVSTL